MSENKIHHLEPQIYYYTFGPNEPALTVSSGDTVVAPTRDARIRYRYATDSRRTQTA